jgi:carbon monoxide dehydrogenase subunit G
MGKIIVRGVTFAALAILAFFAYAAAGPDTFRIERNVSIKAPPDKIFPYIDDFHRWTAWCPWDKGNPEMKRQYSGSQSDKGAVYQWNGNDKLGEGRMEIIDATPPSKVVIQIDIPKGHNNADFTLVPDGDATKVTWAVYGNCDFRMKVMNCYGVPDRVIGKELLDGLTNLKSAAEK